MSEKTEAPTPRRLADAREKGQIARSPEVNAALMMVAAFWLLRGQTANIAQMLNEVMLNTFTRLPSSELTLEAVSGMGLNIALKALLAVAPFAIGLAAVGVVASVAQTGGLFVPSLAAPKLERINPLAGFQRIFSGRGLVEVGKALLKVAVVGWVAYSALKDQAPSLLALGTMDLRSGISLLVDTAFGLGTRVATVYIVIAALDYIYQRRQWLNQLKMSRQDIMQEIKSSEGDPFLKMRIRQQQRRLARQRMMDRVPKANVVIINPTHFAVALMYDKSKMSAPRVVAKGTLLMAQRIVEIARAHNVPVVQNVPLARALYSGVQIDQEIPPALYQAVAEVLAFVFSLKKKSGVRAQTQSLISNL